MLNLLLFGPPGSGKGTQSEMLAKQYDLVHLSTGELIRAEISSETELGLRIKDRMAAGFLASDETVVRLIEQQFKLHPNAKGFILDGFPRTQAQAATLEQMLNALGTSVSGMVELKVPQQELLTRLQLRAQQTNRPEDQDMEAIKKRFAIYQETTANVSVYYAQQNCLFSIDGLQPVHKVFNDICAVVNQVHIAPKGMSIFE